MPTPPATPPPSAATEITALPMKSYRSVHLPKSVGQWKASGPLGKGATQEGRNYVYGASGLRAVIQGNGGSFAELRKSMQDPVKYGPNIWCGTLPDSWGGGRNCLSELKGNGSLVVAQVGPSVDPKSLAELQAAFYAGLTD